MKPNCGARETASYAFTFFYCFKDDSLRGLRISMSDFRSEVRFDNLPLYAIWSYFQKDAM